MHQRNPVRTTHNDLVTDAAYDYYGLRLATGSIDQHIKVWAIDDKGNWTEQDSWKAHDATITRLSWAHPEFGSVIASASFDRLVKVWERIYPEVESNGPQAAGPGIVQRWVERAVLVDARASVRGVEFAPHKFGMKLASISADNTLRIYECLEQPALTAWQLADEIDIPSLRGASSGSSNLDIHVPAAGTMTPLMADAPFAAASGSLGHSPAPSVGPVLSSEPGSMGGGRPGGAKEADGGWAVSWCKDHLWGEILALSAGTDGIVKVVQLNPSRRPTALLVLDPASSASPSSRRSTAPPSAITSVAWAPSCGRSYHLLATGSRDGLVRVWRLTPPPLHDEIAALAASMRGAEESAWKAGVVAEFNEHSTLVSRVEWNVTGTILSSAGNDGKVRLWKQSLGGVWRTAGYVSVESAPEQDGDTTMDG